MPLVGMTDHQWSHPIDKTNICVCIFGRPLTVIAYCNVAPIVVIYVLALKNKYVGLGLNKICVCFRMHLKMTAILRWSTDIIDFQSEYVDVLARGELTTTNIILDDIEILKFVLSLDMLHIIWKFYQIYTKNPRWLPNIQTKIWFARSAKPFSRASPTSVAMAGTEGDPSHTLCAEVAIESCEFPSCLFPSDTCGNSRVSTNVFRRCKFGTTGD